MIEACQARQWTLFSRWNLIVPPALARAAELDEASVPRLLDFVEW